MQEKGELCFLDKTILIYLTFETLLLRWMVGRNYYAYISIILAFIILVRKKRNFRIKLSDVLFSILYLIIIIMNLINNGVKPLFISNFYSQGIANLIIIIYILILNYENKQGLKNFILNDLFRILNSYFIINIPIIIKQLDRTYFLMRYIESNPMYEDHITGLIGASGTHELTFYWSLLVIINLYKQSQTKSKIIPILTGMQVIFMFIISSQNDNTAFFIFFPIIIIQYFFKDIFNNKNIFKKMLKFTIVVMVVIIVGKYIYETNYNVNKFINTRVVSKIEQYSGIIIDSNMSTGSDEERIALFKVALEIGNGYGLGSGIGSIQSYGDPSLPRHFGMSEISFRTYEGGIIYLIILILIFTQFLNRIFITRRRVSSIISFIIIGANIIVMSMYTLVFRQAFYPLSLALMIFIFSQHYNESYTISNK